jgi:AcrR family transcriptional regulator
MSMSQVGTTDFLIEAAGELFARDGFERTTLQAVADRAGVAKGLVAHHFQSKHGLLLAVVEHYYDRLVQTMREEDDPTLEPRARIRALVDVYFNFMAASSAFPSLLQHTANRDPEVLVLARRKLSGLHDWIERNVLTGLAKRGPLSARQMTLTLSGAVMTYFTTAYLFDERGWRSDPLDPEALGERREHLRAIVDALWQLSYEEARGAS